MKDLLRAKGIIKDGKHSVNNVSLNHTTCQYRLSYNSCPWLSRMASSCFPKLAARAKPLVYHK
jgi:hypothetical protein